MCCPCSALRDSTTQGSEKSLYSESPFEFRAGRKELLKLVLNRVADDGALIPAYIVSRPNGKNNQCLNPPFADGVCRQLAQVITTGLEIYNSSFALKLAESINFPAI